MRRTYDNNIFVNKIPNATTEEELLEVFS